MPRRISLTSILNQIRSQYSDHNYQPLKSGEHEEFFYDLSSNEKICDNLKQSENTNDFSDIINNQAKSFQCFTRRILSNESEETFEVVYEIHEGFTCEQIRIIENALQIVINRLFKPTILQNMYQICNKSGCHLTDQIWSQADLTNKSFYKDKHLLLKYQLMCLKAKSENGELPTINIYPKYEDTEYRSTYVSCISHGSSWFVDGEFDIELNLNKLNEHDSNPLFCAGIIIYELLRSLGHLSIDNSNSHQSQIDVFKNCFLFNGNYLPNKTH